MIEKWKFFETKDFKAIYTRNDKLTRKFHVRPVENIRHGSLKGVILFPVEVCNISNISNFVSVLFAVVFVVAFPFPFVQ